LLGDCSDGILGGVCGCAIAVVRVGLGRPDFGAAGGRVKKPAGVGREIIAVVLKQRDKADLADLREVAIASILKLDALRRV
jgi:hypothetical protein